MWSYASIDKHHNTKLPDTAQQLKFVNEVLIYITRLPETAPLLKFVHEVLMNITRLPEIGPYLKFVNEALVLMNDTSLPETAS